VAECLAHIALAGATVLAWLGVGSLLARRLSVGDPLLDLLNRVGVGAISFALLTFAAGWSGVLYAAVFLPVFALAALFGVVTATRRVHDAHLPRVGSWPRWQLALVVVLGVYVGLSLVATCAPISSPDALLYHAADPALFEDARRIFEVPWNSSSYEPFTVEMLVLDGFLLWDSVQGAFAPLLLGLVALAAVVGFAHRVAGRSAALLAGTVFFAQPFMVWEATSVFIEPGLACAVALSAWNAFRFVHDSERNALLFAGLFAGGAAGMKYLGLIAALILAAMTAFVASRRISGRTILAFGLPAAVVALPWYAKNAVLTGNPFYPHVFGGLNPSAAAELERTMTMFGSGDGLLDFLLLPARLLADAEPFDAGEFLSPLFVIFAPIVLLLCRSRLVLAAFVGVALYVVGWFVTTQQARFLVPLMPVMAVLAALGALGLAREGRLGRLVVVSVTGVALAIGFGASSVYAVQFAPVVLGTETKAQFLREKVSNYEGVEALNIRLGPEDKVATDIWALLYLDVPYTTFGTMGDLLPPEAGPAATRAFVATHGVTHVAILAANQDRRRQLTYLDAQLVARVPVRSVHSRTRGDFGRRQDMLVYALEPEQ
jgi:hypothetical protein